MIQKKLVFLPLYLLLALLLTEKSIGDEITLRADEWCPYNCAPDADKKGFMVDIATAVFEEAGHKVDYKLMPWARAVADTKEGKFTAARMMRKASSSLQKSRLSKRCVSL